MGGLLAPVVLKLQVRVQNMTNELLTKFNAVCAFCIIPSSNTVISLQLLSAVFNCELNSEQKLRVALLESVAMGSLLIRKENWTELHFCPIEFSIKTYISRHESKLF